MIIFLFLCTQKNIKHSWSQWFCISLSLCKKSRLDDFPNFSRFLTGNHINFPVSHGKFKTGKNAMPSGGMSDTIFLTCVSVRGICAKCTMPLVLTTMCNYYTAWLKSFYIFNMIHCFSAHAINLLSRPYNVLSKK